MGNFRLIVAALVLLAGSAFGEISPRLDSLAAEVRRSLDLPSGGSGKVTKALYSAVNRGIGKVCADAPALEKYDTLYVDSTTRLVALPADFDRIYSVMMWWNDTGSLGVYLSGFPWPLKPIEGDSIKSKRPTPELNQTTKEDPFSIQWYRTFGNYLQLYGVWTRPTSATLYVEYYAQDTVLTVGGSETSIESKFLEAVVLYAASIISRTRGDGEAQANFRKDYNAVLAEMGVDKIPFGEK